MMWAKAKLVFVLAICVVVLAISNAQHSPQDYVGIHNLFRAEVGVGPVTWNKTLAVYAQNYAEKRKKDCGWVESRGPYGENLMKGSGELTAVQVVSLWHNEMLNYDYESNQCVYSECSFYTQLVWRNSVHIGCGRSRCDNGWYFYICSYDPKGNILGQHPY